MTETATTKAKQPLTEAQRRYVEDEKYFSESIKPLLDELTESRAAVIAESGIGAFFQDDDGTVYHTADKKGQWVDFTPFEIQRTRREAKGTLSLTAAKEAGYEVS